MKWIWVSMPPGVAIRPSPAMTSVPAPFTGRIDPVHQIRLARLADPANPAVLIPISP